MSNTDRLTSGEIGAMLSNLQSAQVKLSEASGVAVAVEVRMRLIGQFSEEVRANLAELVAQSPKKKKRSKNYWDCDLEFLDDAIDHVFGPGLDAKERKQMAAFRLLRNKLLHGDFVGLMELMGIVPSGREILSVSGSRNILESKDVKEAILSIERNSGFAKIRIYAEEVSNILDKIILELAS